eukprot:1209215-Pyramimonas_sp.AAC.1
MIGSIYGVQYMSCDPCCAVHSAHSMVCNRCGASYAVQSVLCTTRCALLFDSLCCERSIGAPQA